MVERTPTAPSEDDAVAIAGRVLGIAVQSATRFPTGLHHWVYDVIGCDGTCAVVRIATRANAPHLAGAVFWEKKLRPLEIPLAPILHADLDGERFPFPFLVLERLPGTDLGNVYRTLSGQQRRELAIRMADLQGRAARLSPGAGYGYALDDAGQHLLPTWPKLLRASLRRSARWIESGGCYETTWVERVRERVAEADAELEAVSPQLFFHDITTKNVIVHEGVLSGIVDVDSMAYGDPLFATALTQASLLASGDELDYVEAWCEAMKVDASGRRRLQVYTALHLLAFLGEVGQAFNQQAATDVDPARRDHLASVLAAVL